MKISYEMIWTENGWTTHAKKIEADNDKQAELLAESFSDQHGKVLYCILDKTTVEVIKAKRQKGKVS